MTSKTDREHGQAEGWLTQAVRLLAEGNAGGAVQAASAACHHAPEEARAHYVYGQAWLAAGEPERAAQASTAAARLRPDWAEPWVAERLGG